LAGNFVVCGRRAVLLSRYKSTTRTGHKQKFSPHRRDGSVGVGRKAIIANVGDCGLRHSGSTYRQVLLPPSADFPPRRGGFHPHLRCSAKICIYKKPWFAENGGCSGMLPFYSRRGWRPRHTVVISAVANGVNTYTLHPRLFQRTMLRFPKRTAVVRLTQLHCPLGGLKKSCRFSSIATLIKYQLYLAESKK